MGDLKDDHPVEANAYAVATAATMENKKKNNYSITPSIKVNPLSYIHL